MAVRVTGTRLDPQDATVNGATARRIFDAPLLAVSMRPAAGELQVRESALLAEPLVLANVMVIGLEDHETWGLFRSAEAERATDA